MEAVRVAYVIRNPAARRVASRSDIEVAAETLVPHRIRVEVIDTTTADESSSIAAQLAGESDVAAIVAAGGDGTLNSVLNGVRSVGRQTPIALLPGGTGNVWAREAGIPPDPRRALALVGTGKRVQIDLGVVQIGDGPSRRFLLVCGVGLDGGVVRDVERRQRLKRFLGRVAFVAPVVKALVRARATDARIVIDGEPSQQSLLLAIASNTRLYGGVARLADDASADDGHLDVVTFEARTGWRGRLDQAKLLAGALRGGLSKRPGRGISYSKAKALEVEPTDPLHVQIDGEYLGECTADAPLKIWVEPLAATLIVGQMEPGLVAGGTGAS